MAPHRQWCVRIPPALPLHTSYPLHALQCCCHMTLPYLACPKRQDHWLPACPSPSVGKSRTSSLAFDICRSPLP